MPGRRIYSLQSVFRLNYVVPTSLHKLASRLPDRSFVFDQKHGFGPMQVDSRVRAVAVARLPGAMFDAGEIYPERRPHTWFAIDPDKPAALLDDPIHGRQPETGPLALFLGGVERLKDVWQMFGVDASPRVAHFESGRNHGSGLNVSIIQFHIVSRNRQLATGRHGIARVGGEIHDNLLELHRIELHFT